MTHDVLLNVRIQNGAIVPIGDAHTHRIDNDKFTWMADNTVRSFDIVFPPGSWPFKGPQQTLSGAPSTYPRIIDENANPVDYKYTVTNVVPSDGSTPPPALDPHIIVDNMGGLPVTLGVDPMMIQAMAEAAFKAAFNALSEQRKSEAAVEEKSFFFPFGIQTISVVITVASIPINITVSGTTPD